MWSDELKEQVNSFDPAFGISTIEEYFHWIKALGNISTKYTILPLDEPHFKIDANTRAINIPDEFKKNGIAVQGDDLAEVVYFKVDRYFDYMDLNNCDIFIQWELPDKNKTQGVSIPYVKDIESAPGYLIFGWGISDLITATAGNLKFSIRFFQAGEVDANGRPLSLNYSFNTLTASVKIAPSIGFDPEKTTNYIPDNVMNRLLARLESGQIAGGYLAAHPIIVMVDDDDDIEDNHLEDITVATNKKVEYDLKDGKIVFSTAAYAPDTGFISYAWERQTINEQNQVDENAVSRENGQLVYIPITWDDNWKSKKYATSINYFIRKNNIYTPYIGNIPPEAEDGITPANGNNPLYVRKSLLEVNAIGQYKAIITNRITNSAETSETIIAQVPYPEDVEITTMPAGTGVLTSSSPNGIELKVVVKENANNNRSYQWYKINDYHQDATLPSDSSGGIAIDNETNATYEAKQPGYYWVDVFNARNGENKADTTLKQKTGVDDNGNVVYKCTASRITNPAQVPTYELENKQNWFESELKDNTEFKIKISNENDDFDKYKVEWYLDNTHDAPYCFATANLELGVSEASFKPKQFASVIEKASKPGKDGTPAQLPNQDGLKGFYYPVITNIFNGSQASTEKNLEDTELRALAFNID